jgi:hypothetical protein
MGIVNSKEREMATPITVKEAESSIWDMFVEACEEEGVDPQALGNTLIEFLEETLKESQ